MRIIAKQCRELYDCGKCLAVNVKIQTVSGLIPNKMICFLTQLSPSFFPKWCGECNPSLRVSKSGMGWYKDSSNDANTRLRYSHSTVDTVCMDRGMAEHLEFAMHWLVAWDQSSGDLPNQHFSRTCSSVVRQHIGNASSTPDHPGTHVLFMLSAKVNHSDEGRPCAVIGSTNPIVPGPGSWWISTAPIVMESFA